MTKRAPRRVDSSSVLEAVVGDSGVRSKVEKEVWPLDGLRVVWVDSVQSDALIARGMLEEWGASVVCVESASDGLDAIALKRPDVVIVAQTQDGDQTPEQVACVLHFMLPTPPPIVVVANPWPESDAPSEWQFWAEPFDPAALIELLRPLKKLAD